MLGTNPIRAPEKGDGESLQVVKIFATLQGEGPNAGEPAVFVRLGGCNLACAFCDTEFEHFTQMHLESILQEVRERSAPGRRLIVITGGEPLRQPIARLCERLLAEGHHVQIETNGTLWRELPAEIEIVCSPKIANGRYYPLRPDLLARAAAIKFLVSAHVPGYADVASLGQKSSTPVYVQPMDERDADRNAANLALAAELTERHGYRLSLQRHKILGIE